MQDHNKLCLKKSWESKFTTQEGTASLSKGFKRYTMEIPGERPIGRTRIGISKHHYDRPCLAVSSHNVILVLTVTWDKRKMFSRGP